MDKVSTKKLQEALRNSYVDKVRLTFEQLGEEVLIVASNEIAIPCLDSEGNEQWVVLKVSVPTGSRNGDVYDGYEMAQDYAQKCADKVEKAQKLAEERAKKKARDEKVRAEKKAQREKANATA